MAAPSTTNTTSTTTPPAQVLQAYGNLADRAQSAANLPLQQYQGSLVAGFQPQQQQAMSEIQNLQGQYAPYLQQAGDAFQQATQPLWPSLPQMDVSGLPQGATTAIGTAQQYAGAAAQPIAQQLYPYTETMMGAAQNLTANAYPYAALATQPVNTQPYTDAAQQAASGVTSGAGYAQGAAQAGTGLGALTSPYTGFGLGTATGLQGQVSPYTAAAQQAAGSAPGNIGTYLSPYTQNVTQALQNLYNQQNAQQQQQVAGSAVAAGAYGGDREAVAQALTAQQEQLAQAPTLAQTQQQGYLSAVQAAQQQAALQAQTGLGAGQLTSQTGLGAGQLGLGAGQLAGQMGVAGGQLGLGAAQTLGQLYGQQGQLQLGAGQLGLQGQLGQGQLGLGAGQLINQAGLGQGQLAGQAGGLLAQGLGTQGQLGLGAGQLNLAAGQGLFGEFNQQQQAQLAAEQANAWLNSQAAFGLSGLGQQAQGLGLQGAQALLQSGGLQQQLAQEQLNVPYEQFQQQQAYPYQQLDFLAPIVEGVGSLAGGTGTTTVPGPSPLSQIGGLGLAGAGLIGATGGFGETGWLSSLFGGGGGGDWSSGAEGGRVGRASGGSMPSIPGSGISISPDVEDVMIGPIPSTTPHGTASTLPRMPTTTQTSGGSGGGGSGLGTAANMIGTVAKFAPLFRQEGGAADGRQADTRSGNAALVSGLPHVPKLSLDYIVHPGPATKMGPGPPQAPRPVDSQNQGPSMQQLTQGLGDLRREGAFGSPPGSATGSSSKASDEAPHSQGGDPAHGVEWGNYTGLVGPVGSQRAVASDEAPHSQGGDPAHGVEWENYTGLFGLDSPSSAARGGSMGLGLPTASRGFGAGERMPHLGGVGMGSAALSAGVPHTSLTHLGVAGPRMRLQVGGLGEEPLSAAAPLQGVNPNVQSAYQQYTQMPLEQLQELALRVPPSTQQGQMVQRALQAKRMTPGAGLPAAAPQPALPSGALPLQMQGQQGTTGGQSAGFQEGGASEGDRNYVTEDELDPHPVVDHSGKTVVVHYPSEGKKLDLGFPSMMRDRSRLATGGTSSTAPSSQFSQLMDINKQAGAAAGAGQGIMGSDFSAAQKELVDQLSKSGQLTGNVATDISNIQSTADKLSAGLSGLGSASQNIGSQYGSQLSNLFGSGADRSQISPVFGQYTEAEKGLESGLQSDIGLYNQYNTQLHQLSKDLGTGVTGGEQADISLEQQLTGMDPTGTGQAGVLGQLQAAANQIQSGYGAMGQIRDWLSASPTAGTTTPAPSGLQQPAPPAAVPGQSGGPGTTALTPAQQAQQQAVTPAQQAILQNALVGAPSPNLGFNIPRPQPINPYANIQVPGIVNVGQANIPSPMTYNQIQVPSLDPSIFTNTGSGASSLLAGDPSANFGLPQLPIGPVSQHYSGVATGGRVRLQVGGDAGVSDATQDILQAHDDLGAAADRTQSAASSIAAPIESGRPGPPRPTGVEGTGFEQTTTWPALERAATPSMPRDTLTPGERALLAMGPGPYSPSAAPPAPGLGAKPADVSGVKEDSSRAVATAMPPVRPAAGLGTPAPAIGVSRETPRQGPPDQVLTPSRSTVHEDPARSVSTAMPILLSDYIAAPGAVDSLVGKIIQREGRSPAGVENNPGNIKFVGLPGQKDSGVHATDGGTFASYDTPEAGRQAIVGLITNAAAGRSQAYGAHPTVDRFMSIYGGYGGRPTGPAGVGQPTQTAHAGTTDAGLGAGPAPAAGPAAGVSGLGAGQGGTGEPMTGLGAHTTQDWRQSPWLPVLAAGAGMLASRSRFPGVALGEGLMTGIKTAETMAGENVKVQQAEARLQRVADQAQHTRDLAARDSQTLQFRYDNLQRLQQADEGNLAVRKQLADTATAKAASDAALRQADEDRKRAHDQMQATLEQARILSQNTPTQVKVARALMDDPNEPDPPKTIAESMNRIAQIQARAKQDPLAAQKLQLQIDRAANEAAATDQKAFAAPLANMDKAFDVEGARNRYRQQYTADLGHAPVAAAPAQQQQQAPPAKLTGDPAALREQAKAAIAAGAPREDVLKRLQASGIDASGL